MLEGEQGDFGSLTLFVGSCVRGAPPFFFPPPSSPPPSPIHTHTHKNGNKAMLAMTEPCPFQNLGDNLQNTV